MDCFWGLSWPQDQQNDVIFTWKRLQTHHFNLAESGFTVTDRGPRLTEFRPGGEDLDDLPSDRYAHCLKKIAIGNVLYFLEFEMIISDLFQRTSVLVDSSRF